MTIAIARHRGFVASRSRLKVLPDQMRRGEVQSFTIIARHRLVEVTDPLGLRRERDDRGHGVALAIERAGQRPWVSDVCPAGLVELLPTLTSITVRRRLGHLTARQWSAQM
jgi:hypothetical protein